MRRITASAAAAGLLLSAAGLPAQTGGEASFVIRIGADTFAVETFTRTPAALEGQISGRAIGRMVYRQALADDASATGLALQAWPPAAPHGPTPAQEVRLELRGEAGSARMTTPAGSRTQPLSTRAGAVVLVNPSFALTEQVVLRARALGGERVEVPVFLAQAGQSATAVVERLGADSVTVTLAGTVVRARTGPDGRLLGGTVAAQNLSFTRAEGHVAYTSWTAPPDYTVPAGAPYTAQEVVVATPAGHTLAGTLTRPAGRGRVAAVVLVSGSGPQDRDGAIPSIPGYHPFREIADTLGRRGIAVLRLDDRGTGGSTGNAASATSADFADDVRAAVAYLRGRSDIDGRRIAVAGHSEGGIIGPMVAATDPALRALVVIAAPARTGRDVVHYQQRFAIEALPGLTATARDSLTAAARVELEEVAARQPWLRFFLDHDPLPVARRVRAPVLVMQGETDRQVTPEQAEALAAAFREGGSRDVAVRRFPEVNHLLLADADGSPGGYTALAERRVAPAVLGALADWLATRLR